MQVSRGEPAPFAKPGQVVFLAARGKDDRGQPLAIRRIPLDIEVQLDKDHQVLPLGAQLLRVVSSEALATPRAFTSDAAPVD
jgi:hypothetical protein